MEKHKKGDEQVKNLQPTGEWVLINIVSAEQSVGGIVLPETVEKESSHNEFIVEAVGEKVTRVKSGDSIVVLPRSIVEINYPNVVKGKGLLKEEHIIAKLI